MSPEECSHQKHSVLVHVEYMVGVLVHRLGSGILFELVYVILISLDLRWSIA